MAEEEILEMRIDEDALAEDWDDSLEATEYSIELNIDDNVMRFQFHNENGVLSSMVMEAADAYQMAQRILRGYDTLEGI